MNRVFVDTSAILALLVASDSAHARARRAFERLRDEEASLITTSHVLLETCTLLGRRFGRESVARFRNGFAPLLEVVWVDSSIHERGLELWVARDDRELSLVDAISFTVLREHKIDRVFACDPRFQREGFAPAIA